MKSTSAGNQDRCFLPYINFCTSCCCVYVSEKCVWSSIYFLWPAVLFLFSKMLLTSSKSTHPCLFPPFVAHDLFWSHDLVRTFALQEMQSTRDPSKVGNTSILQSRQDDVNLSTAGHRLLPVRSTRCWSRVVRLKFLHAGRNIERSQAESSRHTGDRMTARRTDLSHTCWRSPATQDFKLQAAMRADWSTCGLQQADTTHGLKKLWRRKGWRPAALGADIARWAQSQRQRVAPRLWVHPSSLATHPPRVSGGKFQTSEPTTVEFQGSRVAESCPDGVVSPYLPHLLTLRRSLKHRELGYRWSCGPRLPSVWMVPDPVVTINTVFSLPVTLCVQLLCVHKRVGSCSRVVSMDQEGVKAERVCLSFNILSFQVHLCFSLLYMDHICVFVNAWAVSLFSLSRCGMTCCWLGMTSQPMAFPGLINLIVYCLFT